MGCAGDHAEVVDGDLVINAPHQRRHPLAGFCGHTVIRHNGVHMDDRLTAQFFLQFFFHIINLIMDIQHIFRSRHLGVEGDHHPPRTIVVDDQIVNSDNARMGHHQIPDSLDKLMGGRRAQQGVYSLLGRLGSRPQNQSRYQQAYPSINQYS